MPANTKIKLKLLNGTPVEFDLYISHKLETEDNNNLN